ncbi:MAG: nicotinate (nicotinamide) nucleotide adenylyltransferase [Rikenellaceae bacterium]
MKIGLYFGSFNPIHKGHIAISRFMVDNGYCDELWIVVSPQSPFKKADTLASDEDRLTMVDLAIHEEKLEKQIKTCNIEMQMPRPSWSIDTLRLLIETYPEHSFFIVMGEDNLKDFDKWREHDEIQRLAEILVYPRKGIEKGILEAPLLNYDSTSIRKRIKDKKPIGEYVSKSVELFIKEKGIYD